MLTDAIGSYLDSLTEREFDTPFMALLRLQGFIDIHFLHGAFEFGKDFIAKRVEDGQSYQYVFQTKAGDINLAAWGGCRAQIDMMRTDSAAHPNFDKSLNRRACFVITGRLIGAAPLAAQKYGEHLKSLGEADFATWDRDTLVEKLAVEPISLSGSPLELLQILGSSRDQLTSGTLERYSRIWIRSGWIDQNLRDSLEAAVIASHCRRENRIDLACYVSLMLLRSALATTHGREPPPEVAVVAIRTAKSQFRHYARHLWAECCGHFLDPDEMIETDPTPAGFATYPARCLTIVEILALLALLEAEIDDCGILPKELATYLGKFIRINGGSTHPLSDRWSASFVPVILLFGRLGMQEDIEYFVRSCTKWIADYYDEHGFGLAGPYASPNEEVLYLIGSPFEGLQLRRRRESYLASTILDLCSVLEAGDLYDLARNEFLAVDIVLPVIETGDDQGQYSLHVGGRAFEPNMPYQEYWTPTSTWEHAPHHQRDVENRYAHRIDTAWSQLAISCIVRDRHFVKSWRRIIGKPA